MKPAETKRVYERACRTRRMAPQEEEGHAWHRNLRAFELRDVEAAMDAWWASTATDGYGELRSKWLPAPAELKALVAVVEKVRKAKASSPTDYLRWECLKCQRICGGFHPRGDPTPTNRRCPCGGNLKLIERMAA